MKKVTLLAASVALALGLVACDKAPQAPSTAPNQQLPRKPLPHH